VEPGTDTTATPPNTASGTNTDRLIGWFARRRSAKTGRARRWIGLLLLSATLIAAGCEGWLLLQKHRTAVAATQALDAAQAFMRGLTTIDANRIDATHAVLGGMVARGQGRVITVISDAGRVGEPGLIVYSGAKAGAAGFMRAIAKDVGRYGVTANCVALGATLTPAIEPALADEATRGKAVRPYPLGRLGQPADAAALITFLASDAAAWITAQTYPVNGGYSVSV
jgi:NAD(P)-dependent dehydrogenase (short-subunit alcohol dehydrogenase family)